MKRIAYTRPDGGVSVIVPVINSYPVKENLSEDEALHRATKDIPSDATNVVVLEDEDFPKDVPQEKWSLRDGKIVVLV